MIGSARRSVARATAISVATTRPLRRPRSDGNRCLTLLAHPGYYARRDAARCDRVLLLLSGAPCLPRSRSRCVHVDDLIGHDPTTRVESPGGPASRAFLFLGIGKRGGRTDDPGPE